MLSCVLNTTQASEVSCNPQLDDIQDLSDFESIQERILKESCLNYALNPVSLEDVDKMQLKKEALEDLKTQINKYFSTSSFSESLSILRPKIFGDFPWQAQIGCRKCFGSDDKESKEELLPLYKEYFNEDLGTEKYKVGIERSGKAKKALADILKKSLADKTIELFSKVDAPDQTSENEDLLAKMDHIDKIIEAKNKLCNNGVKTVVTKDNGFKSQNYDPSNEDDFINSYEKLNKKIKDAMKRSSDFHQKICTPITSHKSDLISVRNKIEIDLKGGVFFDDNKYKLNDGQKELISEAIDKKISLLKSKNCDVKIKSANIKTSSSLLRNRILKDGKEQLDKSFDFEWLSRQRAYSFANFIFNYSQDKNVDVPPKNKWSFDYLGNNGNGTSGPCPYKIDEQGNPRTIPEIVKNLDEYKYAKAYIEFEQFGEGCTKTSREKTNRVHHFRSQCFNVSFNCKSKN